MFANFKTLFSYRELLSSLTRKELKVKYRGSALGFLWSLLNPILTMLVYSFVFSIVLKNREIEQFAIFLICALLPFNFLSNSVNYGTGSIIGNNNLINKIYFPREIIPLSIVMANLINFFFELAALFIVLAIMGYDFYIYLYLLPVVIFFQFFLVVGMTLLVSALNVFFRDLQHLITVVMMVWFFGTPIIYPLSMVPEKYLFFIKINPMTIYSAYYRSIFYFVKYPEAGGFPSLQDTLIAVAITFIIFFAGYLIFKKLEYRFAEEI
ncbi:MAG: ABC transporter permease [Actinomycetota bacterium]|nr:ABC transporter permease [Actinomycetota bacterium]